MPSKVIAVDIDDTLNDFSATLQRITFPRDLASFLSDATFATYAQKVRAGIPEETDLSTTEYAYFRARMHEECYRQARARPDGVAFMQWLRSNQWRIIICTSRDLRKTNDHTREWLLKHQIPFDHLFMAWNKVVFCRLWGIRYLIDNEDFNIIYGGPHGVEVFYLIADHHKKLGPHTGVGFSSFEELKQWIRE